MVKGVQFRRGSTSDHSAFTGAEGEMTIDTDKDIAVVHDGSTVGGFELVGVNATQTLANKTIDGTQNTLQNLDVTGIVTATSFSGSIAYTNVTGITTDIVADATPQLGGNLDLNSNNITGTGDVNITGIITASTSVNDGIGDLRTIVQNSQTSSYIIQASDAGKHISITTGGVTINASTLSPGDAVTIFNNSASSQTITQGADVTLRQAATANTGNRTLIQYGVCTLLCVVGGATPTMVISGAGLT